MKMEYNITSFIRCHKSIDFFDYNITIDWAIYLLRSGHETENILILASFAKPAEAFEIRPYVSAVLAELGLMELEGEDAINGLIRYHLNEIVHGRSVRSHLNGLHKLYYEDKATNSLTPFYLLYYAWEELEELGVNFYYDGANLDNIENILIQQAENRLEKNKKH